MPALNLTAVVSRRMLAPDESPDDILCDMESMVGAVRRAAGAKHGGERSFAVTTCYRYSIQYVGFSYDISYYRWSRPASENWLTCHDTI